MGVFLLGDNIEIHSNQRVLVRLPAKARRKYRGKPKVYERSAIERKRKSIQYSRPTI